MTDILTDDETIGYPTAKLAGIGHVITYEMTVSGTNVKRPHKFSGPAKIYTDAFGRNRTEYWWINGNQVSGEAYKKWLLDNGMDIYNLSKEDKLLILLTWG